MIRTISEKSAIESFLRRDPYLHLYSLGDLDDFFWPFTEWYTNQDFSALILKYSGTSLPAVLALDETNQAKARLLLRDLASALPSRFYCHVTPGLESELSVFQLESHGLHLKMKLTRTCFCSKLVPNGFHTRNLTIDDEPQITRLYRISYPDNWFDTRMLHSGQYVGLFKGTDLLSIAGIHVYSKRYGVAALGNITTHPDFRGKGLGQAVTSALCEQLFASLPLIGLNVKADNLDAIRCYETLGFHTHTRYAEYMAVRK